MNTRGYGTGSLMKNEPHYLRFTRALALLTGLAGACAESTTQSDSSVATDTSSSTDTRVTTTDTAVLQDTLRPIDTASPVDTSVVDVRADRAATADAPVDGSQARDVVLAHDAAPDIVVVEVCDTCYCPGFDPVPDAGNVASCFDRTETSSCCPVVGPLSPPDLAAFV